MIMIPEPWTNNRVMSQKKHDFYQYYEETYELVGEATNRRFKLGQQVRVTVDNCDRIMRTIDFTLADSDEN